MRLLALLTSFVACVACATPQAPPKDAGQCVIFVVAGADAGPAGIPDAGDAGARPSNPGY